MRGGKKTGKEPGGTVASTVRLTSDAPSEGGRAKEKTQKLNPDSLSVQKVPLFIVVHGNYVEDMRVVGGGGSGPVATTLKSRVSTTRDSMERNLLFSRGRKKSHF